MKSVLIYEKSGNVIEATDDDDNTVEETAKQLLDAIKSRIILIETSNENIILRPSQIEAVVVREENDDDDLGTIDLANDEFLNPEEVTNELGDEPEVETSEEKEDFVTDSVEE